MLKIKRPDYDPVKKLNFIKIGEIDIRKKPDFNKKTNFYDYIRERDLEAEAPDSRGYISIPLIVDRKKPFRTKLQISRDKARLTEIALKKELILPLLDEEGNLQMFGDDILKRPYKFSEVLDLGLKLREYALQYLNNLQEIEFSQSPEYLLMIEILTGKTRDALIKEPVEPGLTTIKTSQKVSTPRIKPSAPQKPTIFPTISPVVRTNVKGQPIIDTPIFENVPITYNNIFDAVKFFIANHQMARLISTVLKLRRRRAIVDQRRDFLNWVIYSVLFGGLYTFIFTLVGIAQDYYNKGYYDPPVIEEYVKEYFDYLLHTFVLFPIEVGVYLVALVTHVIVEVLIRDQRKKIEEKKKIYRSVIKGFNGAYKGFGDFIDEQLSSYIGTLFGIDLKDVIRDEALKKMNETDKIVAKIIQDTYDQKIFRQSKFSIKYDKYDKDFIIDNKKSNELLSYYDSDNACFISVRGVRSISDIIKMAPAIFFNQISKGLSLYKKILKGALNQATNDSKNEIIILAGHSQGAYLISLVYTEFIALSKPSQKFYGFLFSPPNKGELSPHPIRNIIKNGNFKKFSMLQDWISNEIIKVFGRKNISMFDAPYDFEKSHSIETFVNENLNVFLMDVQEDMSYELKKSDFLQEYYIE